VLFKNWLHKVSDHGRLGCPSFLFTADLVSWLVDSVGTAHLVCGGCRILVIGARETAVPAVVVPGGRRSYDSLVGAIEASCAGGGKAAILVGETEVRLESSHGFSGDGFGAPLTASNVEEAGVGNQVVATAEYGRCSCEDDCFFLIGGFQAWFMLS
jgi:hypothetical protein